MKRKPTTFRIKLHLFVPLLSVVLFASTLFLFEFWFPDQYPSPIQSWFNHAPSRVAMNFLDFQSNGQSDKAKELLTGEAETFLHATTEKVTPVKQIDWKVQYQSAQLALITAHWSSATDSFAQDFYLVHDQDDWKIYSIQPHVTAWHSSFRTPPLPPGAKAVIVGYTDLVGKGQTTQAMSLLTGSARLRSSTLSLPSALPIQNIEVVQMQSLGRTEFDDTLVQVTERVRQSTLTLLYTVTNIQGTWKISDIRLMHSEVEGT